MNRGIPRVKLNLLRVSEMLQERVELLRFQSGLRHNVSQLEDVIKLRDAGRMILANAKDALPDRHIP